MGFLLHVMKLFICFNGAYQDKLSPVVSFLYSIRIAFHLQALLLDLINMLMLGK